MHRNCISCRFAFTAPVFWRKLRENTLQSSAARNGTGPGPQPVKLRLRTLYFISSIVYYKRKHRFCAYPFFQKHRPLRFALFTATRLLPPGFPHILLENTWMPPRAVRSITSRLSTHSARKNLTEQWHVSSQPPAYSRYSTGSTGVPSFVISKKRLLPSTQ